MRKGDENIIGMVWLSLILLAAAIIFLLIIPTSYAWPYKLNLTDGSFIDLNTSSINETNFTIYVIYTTSNITINNTHIINNTNVTIYQNITNNIYNITCINCTNITYQNYTYGNSSLNMSDMDARFVQISDFNSYKSGDYLPRGEFNTLVTRVDGINTTVTTEKTNTTGLWAGIIISGLIALIAIFMAWRANN